MSQELFAFDYDGGPRGGKSSIVHGLSSAHPETAAKVEAGQRYRAVTRLLLDNGYIELGMPSEVITQEVTNLGSNNLADIVATVDDVIAEHYSDSLHSVDIDSV